MRPSHRPVTTRRIVGALALAAATATAPASSVPWKIVQVLWQSLDDAP